MVEKKEPWKQDLVMDNVTDVENEKGNTKRLVFKGKDELESLVISLSVSGPSDKVLDFMTRLRAVKAGTSTIQVTARNPQTQLSDF